MKHIFTVHSPITFLCAFSVCKTLNLKESDVIIISSNYKPPFKYGQVVKPYHEQKLSIFQKLRSFNLPRSYDRYITKLTCGEHFTAYIDLMHYWQRLLVTNANCVSFNFLEEGMNSYLKPDTLGEMTFVAQERTFRSDSLRDTIRLAYFALRSYNHKLLNLPYWAMSYRYCQGITYYCFSDLCYPGIEAENKKVVPFIGANAQEDKLQNAIIWIEDIYNKRHVADQNVIDDALDRAVKFIDAKYGKTHRHTVKFRPSGSVANSEVVPILEKNGLAFDTIETAEPLELILERSKDLVLVSATSSLLFYGKTMGHEAYTYFWLLRNRRHSSFEGMGFYWTLVKRI